ncbi:polysaccharide deacetylase family protein [Geobacter sp. SVR]|uniref:polysaccharide deacetylase family protein n=1 Tax=Geobacter sp. SVR TaxID=2495594 RepID=UPI00143EF521|nr:polysaccharide deacetylase family protein [Geobacter sp. SVR]BCS54957.1 polysaccharide deacetylase [Geobacter sp. SVR]GCF86156.1 polysaccharide deacetylase [Geobacter sp. SVR]
MTPKIFIRRVLSALLSSTGIHALLERLYLSDKAFILMYHRIVPMSERLPPHVQPGMVVSATTFEKHVSFLRGRFKIVFLDELMAKVRKGESIGRCCALTFDDGWRDNYSEAFPILKKYAVPATIFLATGYVGTRKTFWTDEVSSCIDRLNIGAMAEVQAPDSVRRFSGELEGLQKKAELFREELIELLKKKSPHDREEILAHLLGDLSVATTERLMLNWEEAGEMAESGLVRFGAHTVHHELLDQLPLQRVREEVQFSRMEIENRLRQKVTTFAYPNGNCSESVRQIVKEYGFDAAVTTRRGYLESGISPLDAPRIGLHEDTCATIPMLRSRVLLQAF